MISRQGMHRSVDLHVGAVLAAIRWTALLAVLLPSAAFAADRPHATAVVITTDCGADMDDQWAIAHTALSPRIRTLAVIGNFVPDKLRGADTAQCARQALAAVGRLAGIPVHAGADGRLKDRATPIRNRGVDALIRLSKRFSPGHRLVVIGLGPVTDIASAVLIDPTVVRRIAVVALAFDSYPGGGDGWNVRNDVAAWQVLLDSDIPVTTASGTLARDTLAFTRSESAAAMRGLGAPGAYLACLHQAWLDTNGNLDQGEDKSPGARWPIWDEAVTAVLLGLSTQQEKPRPALNDDMTFSTPNSKSRAPYRWVERVDRDGIFRNLADLLRQLNGKRGNPFFVSNRAASGAARPSLAPEPQDPWRTARMRCWSMLTRHVRSRAGRLSERAVRHRAPGHMRPSRREHPYHARPTRVIERRR